MSAIVNTTVLSNFAGVGSLDLLHRLFGHLFISVEVYQEIQNGVEKGYLFYEAVLQAISPAAKDGWIHLTSLTGEEEVEAFLSMPAVLHSGEASILAIAGSRRWTVFTDDRAARKQAATLGIPVSGTLGVLVGAVEKQLLSLQEGNRLLEQVVASGFYSPVSDLSSLIKTS